MRSDGGVVSVVTTDGTDEYVLTRVGASSSPTQWFDSMGNRIPAPASAPEFAPRFIPGTFTTNTTIGIGELGKLAELLGMSEAEAAVPSIQLKEDEPAEPKELKYSRKLEP